MATHLDLQEQEQIDEIKHFWQRYGTPILAVITVALLAYAGWNGWQWYQREQATKAALLFDELERAAGAKEGDKVQRAFSDLKDRFASTTWARQGALVSAKSFLLLDKRAEARAALEWAAEQSGDADYQWIARMRLAGMLLDDKQNDAALQRLSGTPPASMAGLVLDRRGDVLMALGKRDEAVAAYKDALKALDIQSSYRLVLEAKLETLGVPVAPSGDGR